jgi:hypothetical protein
MEGRGVGEAQGVSESPPQKKNRQKQVSMYSDILQLLMFRALAWRHSHRRRIDEGKEEDIKGGLLVRIQLGSPLRADSSRFL